MITLILMDTQGESSLFSMLTLLSVKVVGLRVVRAGLAGLA
jgi:hypothetical protein